MRNIIYEEVNYIDFGVDIFKLDLNGDINEQINNIATLPEHQKNMFVCDSINEAERLAKRMITRDSDYNCAIITLYKYEYNEEIQDIELIDNEIIGELWSDDIDVNKLN